MQKKDHQLPSFRSPPLDEVAIAIQFQGIERFSLAYGAFFERIRSNYPVYEEHDPIPVQFETFGRSQEVGSEISLESLSLRRGWYISSDGHELVQLQPNRLVQNWRRINGQGEYPRFPAVFSKFQENLETIKLVLNDLSLSQIQINQVDITYFNNIPLLMDENNSSAFERIFQWPEARRMSEEAAGFSIAPEAVNFNVGRLVFAPGSTTPCARLVASAVPAETDTGQKVIRFQLRFRGPLSSEGTLEQFFEVARSAIVKSFTDLTSPECHILWERET